MKGRLLFVLALWMAISVALLSALAPLGPPSSRVTGSAFNPATTSVVLKARTQSIPVDSRLTDSDGKGHNPLASPWAAWIISIPGMLAVAWVVRSVAQIVQAYLSRPLGRFLYRFHARAPPVLT